MPCTKKKELKFAPVVELAKQKLAYITDHSSKIVKARPGYDYDVCPEHPPDKF